MAIKFTGELAPQGDLYQNKLMDAKWIDYSSTSTTLNGLRTLTAVDTEGLDATDYLVGVTAAGAQKKFRIQDILLSDFDGAGLSGDITGVSLTSDNGTATDNDGSADFSIVGSGGIDTSVSATTLTVNYTLPTIGILSDFDVTADHWSYEDVSNGSQKMTQATFLQSIQGGSGTAGNNGLYTTSNSLSIKLNATSGGDAPAVSADSGLVINDSGLSLASIADNTGEFGDSTNIPTITVDAYGRVTALTSTGISTSFNIMSDDAANETAQVVEGGSTLEIAGGTNITTQHASDGQTVTISLKDAITASTIGQGVTGNEAQHTLWGNHTGAIVIGATGSAATFTGTLAATQGFTSINASDLEVEDAAIVVGTNVGSTDFGGAAATGAIDTAIVFAGLDADALVLTDSCKLICSHDGFLENAVPKALLKATYMDNTTYASATDADAGVLACFSGAGYVFDSSTGATIKANAADNSDGTVVWDGTDLWIFDAA